MRQPTRKPRLLAVEDNQADMELLRVLITDTKVALDLYTASDGVEATNFLFKRDKFASDGTIVDLVLMDLNVPRRDGLTILREMKNDEELCKTPVVILSTSSSERDVNESYRAGASAFLTKPVDLNEYQERISSMIAFYFGGVTLATRLNSR